jgi:hypothetical protein
VPGQSTTAAIGEIEPESAVSLVLKSAVAAFAQTMKTPLGRARCALRPYWRWLLAEDLEQIL